MIFCDVSDAMRCNVIGVWNTVNFNEQKYSEAKQDLHAHNYV